MRSIVCGVTASEEARDAARLAAALADEFGTRLVLAHVVEMPEFAADSVTASRERAEAERMLSALGRELPYDADTVVAMGEPAEAIATLAADHDASLIVVGARRSGLRGGRLRSGLALELPATTATPVVVAAPRAVLRPAATRPPVHV